MLESKSDAPVAQSSVEHDECVEHDERVEHDGRIEHDKRVENDDDGRIEHDERIENDNDECIEHDGRIEHGERVGNDDDGRIEHDGHENNISTALQHETLVGDSELTAMASETAAIENLTSPEAAALQDGWECEHCTFHNDMSVKVCSMCFRTSLNAKRITNKTPNGLNGTTSPPEEAVDVVTLMDPQTLHNDNLSTRSSWKCSNW